MKEMTKALVSRVLRRFGYRIERIPLDRFFRLLKRLGFEPRHVIDVGANHGAWTRRALKYFPDCSFTLVEPQDHLKVHIKDLLTSRHDVNWVHAGAGDEHGKMLLTIWDKDHSSTFVLSKEEAAERGFDQVEVDVLTLNEIVAQSGLPKPDMVKIDAEGFDLKVIQGASDLIGETEIFLLEVAVCDPVFSECRIEKCLAVMKNHGYVMFEMTEVVRLPKHWAFWNCELAFIRECSPILREAEIDSWSSWSGSARASRNSG